VKTHPFYKMTRPVCRSSRSYHRKSDSDHTSIMATHNNGIDAPVVSTNNMEFRALVTQAQTSADLDSKLTVMQALKKHKKAVFWAMILSTSLVMEGYDLVIVRISGCSLSTCLLTLSHRSTRSMANHNSREDSASKSHLGSGPFPLPGSLDCPTRLSLAN